MILAPSMFLHVAAGSVGLVSGATALAVRKGGRLHRASGKLFLLSMAATAALGAYLGVSVHRGALLIGGILTCYMLATAWMTVHRKAGTIGLFERIAPFGAMGVTALCLSFAVQATNSRMGQFQGIPAAAYCGQALVAAVAFGLDIKIILRGGISGVPRIARHIWRVCLAFFEATSAFFVGQQKVMPMFMHGSPVLMILGAGPLLVMAFWLCRIRLTGSVKGDAIHA